MNPRDENQDFSEYRSLDDVITQPVNSETLAIQSLREYLRGDEERHHIESSDPPDEMMRDLPTPYEVTLLFGDQLLRCSQRRVRDLFCLGAFLLKEGVSKAVHLVRTGQVEDTIGFPSHLFRLSEVPGVSNVVAARMERHRVMFLFAKEAAYSGEMENMYFMCNSVAKHMRSDTLIQYCNEADRVLEAMPDGDSVARDMFLDVIQPHIRRMIQKCNHINLLNKLSQTSNHSREGILKKELGFHE